MTTFTVSIPGGRIGNFLAGAAVASIIGGTAVAVTSSDFTYSGVKAGYFSIGPQAMAPRDYVAAEKYFANSITVSSTAHTTVCFVTGINLPQGATLTSLTIYFSSNDQADLSIGFLRKTLLSNIVYSLLQKTPVENSGSFQAFTYPISTGRTISNATYSYGLEICLAAGTNFYGARVAYAYKTAGD